MHFFSKLTFEYCSNDWIEPSDLFYILTMAFGVQRLKAVVLDWFHLFSSFLEEILCLFVCLFFCVRAYQESSPLPHHSNAFLFMKIPDFSDGGFWWCSFSVHFLIRPKRTLYSKKYGVDLIRYTHAANTVVYSSNKIDGKQVLFLGVTVMASFVE